MSAIPQMQTVEILGHQIEFNPSNAYGIFNSQGIYYGIAPAELLLPNIALYSDNKYSDNKEQFIDVLDDSVNYYRTLKNRGIILEVLVGKSIFEVDGTSNESLRTEGYNAIQQTIDLFQDIADTLRN